MKSVYSLFIAALVAVAFGADSLESTVPTLSVTGEGILQVDPDTAVLRIGVVTQARTAGEAAAENGAALTRVFKALTDELAAADELRNASVPSEIKTVQFSIDPIYNFSGGVSRIVGFTATNTLQIRTGDLDIIGRLIDIALSNGANSIDSLTFTVDDTSSLRLEALSMAATNALDKAKALAEPLGVSLKKVLRASEQSFVMPQPLLRLAVGPALEGATTIQPGSLEIRASMSLVVEIEQVISL